jgi:hypothetical protein
MIMPITIMEKIIQIMKAIILPMLNLIILMQDIK